MARGPQKKDPKDGKDGGGGKKEIPTFKLWFEEAWHGWLRPVAVIFLLVGGYLAYDKNLLGNPEKTETTFGLLVVGLIIGGAILTAVGPLFQMVESRQQKLLLGIYVVAWAAAVGYPSLKRAFPAQPIGDPVQVGYCARWKDVDKKDCAEETKVATAKVDKGSPPYEIEVSGELAGQGDTEAPYSLDLTGADGSTDHVEGKLERNSWHQRTSRRGSSGQMVHTEHTEDSHRLTLHGPEVKVEADVATDRLEHGLTISFHNAGPDPRLFYLLGLICVLIGIALDYKFAAPKVKTYVTMAAAFTLVFAWHYPTVATPHNLVRRAIESGLIGLTGLVGGWLIALIVKSFKPKPKKVVR
jgi:hypothetical protein